MRQPSVSCGFRSPNKSGEGMSPQEPWWRPLKRLLGSATDPCPENESSSKFSADCAPTKSFSRMRTPRHRTMAWPRLQGGGEPPPEHRHLERFWHHRHVEWSSDHQLAHINASVAPGFWKQPGTPRGRSLTLSVFPHCKHWWGPTLLLWSIFDPRQDWYSATTPRGKRRSPRMESAESLATSSRPTIASRVPGP